MPVDAKGESRWGSTPDQGRIQSDYYCVAALRQPLYIPVRVADSVGQNKQRAVADTHHTAD